MAATWQSLTTREKALRASILFFFALLFPICLVIVGYSLLSSLLRSQAILADHYNAQAVISIDEETPSTEQLARFKYSFEVNGQTYSDKFPVPWTRADDMEVGGTLPVAYANFDPNSFTPDVRFDPADPETGSMHSQAPRHDP